ncbi:MAG TPA: hypothetical protein DDX85_02965 [Nitrospiraceae bacterium]|nr:hypothetical protein [Nitrospiraceae bacterium]
MKHTPFILVVVFLLPFLSYAETTSLKLRASRSTGSVRIVLEGPESVIGKGSVTQKESDILVSFPGTGISIQAESAVVAYLMINKETIRISPGDISGMKVFTLKDPSRLVIDAYFKEEKVADPSVSEEKKQKETSPLRIKAVVIDPGHGGYENGIVKDESKEKNRVLDIAQKLGARINSGPSRGFLTRGSDRYMTLGERINFATSKAADVFISLHIGNHSDIVIYSPVVTERPADIVRAYLRNRGQAEYARETLTLLKALSEAITPVFGENMLSFKPIPYTIISRIQAAALIVELPSYEYASYTDEYNSKIADTIYKGLTIYEEASAR